MRRLAASVCALIALAAACGDDDDNAADTTTSTPTTTALESSNTTQPVVPLDSAVVMASPAGVEILSPDGHSTPVSTRPAASAYAVGADLVVFQGAEESGGAFPASADGPVIVWSNGEARDLPTDPEASRVLLLDAVVIDGAPVALIAERFGEVGPDDTFEALVRVDLRDDTRTTIVRRPAWESGHAAARFLPDGNVIGLFASEAQLLLARWSPTRKEAVWTVEVGIDTYRDLTLRHGRITLIQVSFVSSRNFAPVVSLTTIDETAGREIGSTSVDINDPGGEIDAGLFCRDWTADSTLLCGRRDGVALSISVDDGSFRLLAGEPGGIPTVVRPV